MKQIDERDVMFARMARKPGSPEYDEYYGRNPQKKEGDDLLRMKPPMGDETAKFFAPHDSALVDASFQFLSDIKGLVDGPSKANVKVIGTAEDFTSRLKAVAALYGARLTGVAEYDAHYYYSHRGRQDGDYGDAVYCALPYTFVFAVEMDRELIETAPKVTQSIAVTKGYIDAAVVGMVLTYWIKQMGYEARNHMDGNYLMVMPLAARAAGLGDIGRHGLLITKEFGSRVRLGAVTTDLPLVVDGVADFSVSAFCETCGVCARFCPAKAIDSGERKLVDGVLRWQIEQEKCYGKWQSFGSDCGICVARCPFGG
jgi:ferredoxin